MLEIAVIIIVVIIEISFMYFSETLLPKLIINIPFIPLSINFKGTFDVLITADIHSITKTYPKNVLIKNNVNINKNVIIHFKKERFGVFSLIKETSNTGSEMGLGTH